MRQVPETDKGVIFVTLEDEIGSVNFIVWRHIRERQRLALLRSRLLAVARRQRAKDGGTYLIARRLVDVRRGWAAWSSAVRGTLTEGLGRRQVARRGTLVTRGCAVRASDCFKAINSGERVSLMGVRREKAALSSGCKPRPATAPAGSNRSRHGGDEMSEAFG